MTLNTPAMGFLNVALMLFRSAIAWCCCAHYDSIEGSHAFSGTGKVNMRICPNTDGAVDNSVNMVHGIF